MKKFVLGLLFIGLSLGVSAQTGNTYTFAELNGMADKILILPDEIKVLKASKDLAGSIKLGLELKTLKKNLTAALKDPAVTDLYLVNAISDIVKDPVNGGKRFAVIKPMLAVKSFSESQKSTYEKLLASVGLAK